MTEKKDAPKPGDSDKVLLRSVFRSILGPFVMLIAAAALALAVLSLSGYVTGVRIE